MSTEEIKVNPAGHPAPGPYCRNIVGTRRQRRRRGRRLSTFAINVKVLLEYHDWSAPELARRARISPKTLNNLLSDRHWARIDVLAKVAEAFGVELWLMLLPTFPRIFRRLVLKAAQLPPKSLRRMAAIEIKVTHTRRRR